MLELASDNLKCQWNCSTNLFPKSHYIPHFLQELIFSYFWGFGTQGFHQDMRLLNREDQAINTELDLICLKFQDCSDVKVLVRHSFSNSNGTLYYYLILCYTDFVNFILGTLRKKSVRYLASICLKNIAQMAITC